MVDIYEHMALDRINLDAACIIEYVEDIREALKNNEDVEGSLQRIECACKQIDIVVYKILNGQLERLP